MTILIAYYSSNGCEGRCDAKCYNAVDPKCTCICGGLNHGVGLSQAMDNTQKLAEKWIETYSKEHNLDPETTRWKVPAKEPRQLSLF